MPEKKRGKQKCHQENGQKGRNAKNTYFTNLPKAD